MEDDIAVEEPLEIRVEGKNIAITMRTPGNDEELAAGFLFSEGVVSSPADFFEISQCPSTGDAEGNGVDVLLRDASALDLERLTRHVFTSSSCGLCGKATIDAALRDLAPVPPSDPVLARVLLDLPKRLASAQSTFQKTGGVHACATFSRDGELDRLREDVGRHNALDKVIGASLLAGDLPLGDRLLLLSGRVSFEMMQKAWAAGIPIVAAISAPSSLAIDLANESGQTLVGFLREGGFNIYAHGERISEAK